MKSVAMKLKPLFMLCVIILCGAVAVYVSRNADSADSVFWGSVDGNETMDLIRELTEENNELRKTIRELETYQATQTPCVSNTAVTTCDEVIHIGFVCAGYKSSRSVVTVLKSLLFYRKNPLHFHFVSDKDATVVLQTLFDSWHIPSVSVSFYPTENLKAKVSWITNRHYSGTFGLLKLLVPTILDSSLSKVMLLDTDITLTADIGELWSYFYKFAKKQIFGLVDNQSDWYLGTLWKKHHPWPALGRGFNTGVILMDLKAMQELDWQQMWTDVAKKYLKSHKYTQLADQDIINSLIYENPSLVYRLPCQWNVQFSKMSNSDLCYRNASDLKAVHWNSLEKVDGKMKLPEYFRNLYLTFLEYDGNLLRRELIGCPSSNSYKAPEVNEKDKCYDFRREQVIVRRTHLYYLDFELPANETSANDVTLITQLSIDRLQMIESLSAHWPGPMSIALYLSDAEAQQFRTYVMNSENLSRRKNIAYHIVYREGEFYPVNLLRNVAMNNALTPYLFLCDVDFLPMTGLYQYAKNTVKQYSGKKHAFIVPAFETQRYRLKFPKTKIDALTMLDSSVLYTFRYDVWPEGHAPTNYLKWRTANKPYKINWAPNFEPYVIIPSTAPRFDERFVGFGWNKVSHIIQLDAEGYEFNVLPDSFMIHLPHAPSNDIAKFRTSKRYRECLQTIKEEFLQSLEDNYGSKAKKYKRTK